MKNSKLTSSWGRVLNKKIQMLRKIKKPVVTIKGKKIIRKRYNSVKLSQQLFIDKILRFVVNYLWGRKIN